MLSLGCIAPPEFHDILSSRFAEVGIRASCLVRPAPTSTFLGKNRFCQDPFGLERISDDFCESVDGLLLVSPRNRAPRTIAKGALVKGRPLGLVFANRPSDLLSWLDGLVTYQRSKTMRTWAMLAMWKSRYMKGAKRFHTCLKKRNGRKVINLMGDKVNRDELCEGLAASMNVALYLGHGRGRGLSGYCGLRWKHIKAVSTPHVCGSFLCISCDTLKRTNGVFPFGCQWVHSGRAGAFLGAVDAVSQEENSVLAQTMGEILAEKEMPHLGSLLKEVSLRFKQDNGLSGEKILQQYRIIGNPLQDFHET